MSGFESVIGYEESKAELMRYADALQHPEKYKKLGLSMPRGVLLYGEPGLGKTTMAEAFVDFCKLPTFHLRKEKPSGDFINEIRATFEKARESSPSIVFLDDMDKFANEDHNHRDASEYVAIQAGIDDSKEFDVFVIATANDKRSFPDSLLRVGRFDKTIKLSVPTGSDSEKIIRYYLSQKNTMGDVEVELIERLMEGRSCAELENVINEAGIYAGYAGRDQISQDDFLKACLSMLYVKKNNDGFELFDGTINLDSPYIRETAAHEVGHVVVSEILEPGSVSVVSINATGEGHFGTTIIRRPEGFLFSIELLENDVIRKLGSRAALEVVFGKYDVLSETDMSEAAKLVSGLKGGYLGAGYMTGRVSDNLLEKSEYRVEVEVEKYYQKAVGIIVKNRELFDAIYEELLKKETLTYKDIAVIRERINQ